MSFVWQRDDLNQEQVDAITTQGNVFLTACPGSGKTRALTYKAALELTQLANNKQRVVAITYTHRAADEIKERIESMGVDTSQLWIGTIHGFCLEWILRPYGVYHEALKNGFRVIDAHEAEQKLAEHCKTSRPRVRPFECGYNFTSKGFELRENRERLRVSITSVLERFWSDLEANRQIDFEMILKYAYDLVVSVPSIATLLGQIFRYVLVDEYQDTKEIQYNIVAQIMRASGGGTNAFVVGDANQAIFGSLGGYAISVEQLSELCQSHFTEKNLTTNYRSSSKIVDYFSGFQVASTKVDAAGKHREFPSFISYNRSINHKEIEDELVRLLRYNIDVVGIEPHEICIVGPQWIPLASITRRLMSVLPEYSFDGPGMAPFGRNVDNFFYKLARLALTEPAPQLYIRRLRWAGEILNELETVGAHVRNMSRKRLLRLSNEIKISEEDGVAYLHTYFDELFYQLEIDLPDHPALLDHHSAFFADATARIERLEADGVQGISNIAMFRRVFASRSGITISTIHNVKGAEFDVVIAFALLQGMVPHFADQSTDSAKKLVYVICSRARKNLHLISETGRTNRRAPYEPTEIIADLEFNYDEVQ